MHTPAMFRHLSLLLGFSIATLHAADPVPADLLRQGLFEEEANQNLDKAAEHYRAVIAAHERERALAASATFRLGEIARKKNDKEAAAAAFRTVTERFPEQQELARLSRENLAALGIETTAPASLPSADPEDAEIARLKEVARNSPDLIDGAGPDGWRPIHHAAAKGWSKVISFLLENKADPNARTSTDDEITPLHLAAIHGHLGAVKTLLAGKADSSLTFDIKKIFHDRYPPAGIKSPDVSGQWTALDLAILYDRRETALALIQAGSDFLRKGPLISGGFRGANSLQLAIYFQRDELAQTMIDAAKPGTATVRGDLPHTPLATAVIHNPAMVDPLLKAGADVRETIIEGATVLHWAPSAEMAELLISKGADPNAKDTSGLTPLDYVAQRSEAGKNADIIETLLKHGATVADPSELLRRTSEAMLPVVGERLVYPNAHNPDAILLSAYGDHRFSVVQPSPQTANTPRPRVQRPIQGRPELVTLEKRPAEGSPPPSLAEALREAYGSSGFLLSIRILRRNGNEAFETVREWKSWETPPLSKDWPALEWGDIIEVRTAGGGNSSSIRIADLSALIPSRNVTFRLGELEIPKTIPGDKTFWLGGNSYEPLQLIYPSIESLALLHRCVIHRKGLPGPVALNFSEPTHTRFRLLDGDMIEVSLNVPVLEQKFPNKDIIYEYQYGAGEITEAGSGGNYNLLDRMVVRRRINAVDYSRIGILRRAENFNPEMMDLKAWLEKLPPREKWNKDTLMASLPKLNPGDVVVLIGDQAPDAEKTAAEVVKKLKEVQEAMR